MRARALADALKLDQRIYDDAAWNAHRCIQEMGFCIAAIQPGDGTKYVIMVSKNFKMRTWEAEMHLALVEKRLPRHQHVRGDVYHVSCSLSGQYEWSGEEIGEPGYVAFSWFRGTDEPNVWTVACMFRFLNTLADLFQHEKTDR